MMERIMKWVESIEYANGSNDIESIVANYLAKPQGWDKSLAENFQ